MNPALYFFLTYFSAVMSAALLTVVSEVFVRRTGRRPGAEERDEGVYRARVNMVTGSFVWVERPKEASVDA